jgi:hypothetical protein
MSVKIADLRKLIKYYLNLGSLLVAQGVVS